MAGRGRFGPTHDLKPSGPPNIGSGDLKGDGKILGKNILCEEKEEMHPDFETPCETDSMMAPSGETIPDPSVDCRDRLVREELAVSVIEQEVGSATIEQPDRRRITSCELRILHYWITIVETCGKLHRCFFDNNLEAAPDFVRDFVSSDVMLLDFFTTFPEVFEMRDGMISLLEGYEYAAFYVYEDALITTTSCPDPTHSKLHYKCVQCEMFEGKAPDVMVNIQCPVKLIRDTWAILTEGCHLVFFNRGSLRSEVTWEEMQIGDVMVALAKKDIRARVYVASSIVKKPESMGIPKVGEAVVAIPPLSPLKADKQTISYSPSPKIEFARTRGMVTFIGSESRKTTPTPASTKGSSPKASPQVNQAKPKPSETTPIAEKSKSKSAAPAAKRQTTESKTTKASHKSVATVEHFSMAEFFVVQHFRDILVKVGKIGLQNLETHIKNVPIEANNVLTSRNNSEYFFRMVPSIFKVESSGISLQPKYKEVEIALHRDMVQCYQACFSGTKGVGAGYPCDICRTKYWSLLPFARRNLDKGFSKWDRQQYGLKEEKQGHPPKVSTAPPRGFVQPPPLPSPTQPPPAEAAKPPNTTPSKPAPVPPINLNVSPPRSECRPCAGASFSYAEITKSKNAQNNLNKISLGSPLSSLADLNVSGEFLEAMVEEPRYERWSQAPEEEEEEEEEPRQVIVKLSEGEYDAAMYFEDALMQHDTLTRQQLAAAVQRAPPSMRAYLSQGRHLLLFKAFPMLFLFDAKSGAHLTQGHEEVGFSIYKEEVTCSKSCKQPISPPYSCLSCREGYMEYTPCKTVNLHQGAHDRPMTSTSNHQLRPDAQEFYPKTTRKATSDTCFNRKPVSARRDERCKGRQIVVRMSSKDCTVYCHLLSALSVEGRVKVTGVSSLLELVGCDQASSYTCASQVELLVDRVCPALKVDLDFIRLHETGRDVGFLVFEEWPCRTSLGNLCMCKILTEPSVREELKLKAFFNILGKVALWGESEAQIEIHGQIMKTKHLFSTERVYVGDEVSLAGRLLEGESLWSLTNIDVKGKAMKGQKQKDFLQDLGSPPQSETLEDPLASTSRDMACKGITCPYKAEAVLGQEARDDVWSSGEESKGLAWMEWGASSTSLEACVPLEPEWNDREVIKVDTLPERDVEPATPNDESMVSTPSEGADGQTPVEASTISEVSPEAREETSTLSFVAEPSSKRWVYETETCREPRWQPEPHQHVELVSELEHEAIRFWMGSLTSHHEIELRDMKGFLWKATPRVRQMLRLEKYLDFFKTFTSIFHLKRRRVRLRDSSDKVGFAIHKDFQTCSCQETSYDPSVQYRCHSCRDKFKCMLPIFFENLQVYVAEVLDDEAMLIHGEHRISVNPSCLRREEQDLLQHVRPGDEMMIDTFRFPDEMKRRVTWVASKVWGHRPLHNMYRGRSIWHWYESEAEVDERQRMLHVTTVEFEAIIQMIIKLAELGKVKPAKLGSLLTCTSDNVSAMLEGSLHQREFIQTFPNIFDYRENCVTLRRGCEEIGFTIVDMPPTCMEYPHELQYTCLRCRAEYINAPPVALYNVIGYVLEVKDSGGVVGANNLRLPFTKKALHYRQNQSIEGDMRIGDRCVVSGTLKYEEGKGEFWSVDNIMCAPTGHLLDAIVVVLNRGLSGVANNSSQDQVEAPSAKAPDFTDEDVAWSSGDGSIPPDLPDQGEATIRQEDPALNNAEQIKFDPSEKIAPTRNSSSTKEQSIEESPLDDLPLVREEECCQDILPPSTSAPTDQPNYIRDETVATGNITSNGSIAAVGNTSDETIATVNMISDVETQSITLHETIAPVAITPGGIVATVDPKSDEGDAYGIETDRQVKLSEVGQMEVASKKDTQLTIDVHTTDVSPPTIHYYSWEDDLSLDCERYNVKSALEKTCVLGLLAISLGDQRPTPDPTLTPSDSSESRGILVNAVENDAHSSVKSLAESEADEPRDIRSDMTREAKTQEPASPNAFVPSLIYSTPKTPDTPGGDEREQSSPEFSFIYCSDLERDLMSPQKSVRGRTRRKDLLPRLVRSKTDSINIEGEKTVKMEPTKEECPRQEFLHVLMVELKTIEMLKKRLRACSQQVPVKTFIAELLSDVSDSLSHQEDSELMLQFLTTFSVIFELSGGVVGLREGCDDLCLVVVHKLPMCKCPGRKGPYACVACREVCKDWPQILKTEVHGMCCRVITKTNRSCTLISSSCGKLELKKTLSQVTPGDMLICSADNLGSRGWTVRSIEKVQKAPSPRRPSVVKVGAKPAGEHVQQPYLNLAFGYVLEIDTASLTVLTKGGKIVCDYEDLDRGTLCCEKLGCNFSYGERVGVVFETGDKNGRGLGIWSMPRERGAEEQKSGALESDVHSFLKFASERNTSKQGCKCSSGQSQESVEQTYRAKGIMTEVTSYFAVVESFVTVLCSKDDLINADQFPSGLDAFFRVGDRVLVTYEIRKQVCRGVSLKLEATSRPTPLSPHSQRHEVVESEDEMRLPKSGSDLRAMRHNRLATRSKPTKRRESKYQESYRGTSLGEYGDNGLYGASSHARRQRVDWTGRGDRKWSGQSADSEDDDMPFSYKPQWRPLRQPTRVLHR